ncbi:MAG: hypothetical protein HKN89_01075 [Eudoraea sp.]|nr:hypothetical protein [Eudoraea sp.]
MQSTSRFTQLIFLFCIPFVSLLGQDLTGVFMATEEVDGKQVTHELKFGTTYSMHTAYEASPPKFIKTLGGFHTVTADSLFVELEFNSDFAQDSVATKRLAYTLNGNSLVINGNTDRTYQRIDSKEQDLDGAWMFGTRGPDTGQDRRGDTRDRKTLKFLMGERFQWIAYTVGSFKFSGTGGGSFTSKNGKYVEQIEFFSRDDSRVGATLDFMYEVDGNDWHHKGKNSRGEPMYEIWMRRER